MAAPDKVLELVERFDYNLDAYRSGTYNETQVRREFIDPLFKALGWDIDNEQGYAEAYKDVIHEDAIKIGGQTKAPDYSFRIGGTRKFFLEAKKPSVNIKTDLPPAFQLRRYAWSAKLPLSILTDFEELAVYDCRIQPNPTDKASTARIRYMTFQEYPERWDELAGVFSREAILKGSFDKYASDTKSKRGTAEVDDAFLKEIETWRELLAKNIALRNPGLTQRELNTAVQKTIDRIIFLRICEDRGIEPYNALGELQKGPNVYNRLGYLFQRADDRYNSGLFHFQKEKNRAEEPDTFTLGLTIDDKPLKEILKGLYYPHSPYEFSVLPADILGQVYEQFLGKVIVLDDRHRATVEEKPEVKKAGGVYYTPTYIVDYIVQNTVGKLLEGKTPNQISTQGKTPPLRVLDPACGSGSFLIGAYQHLLDWHIAWYTENDPEKYAKGRSPRLYKGKAQDWRLTTDERKRILLTHIYGVDIDAQAVEVTKLSLLLKMLEGENNDTLEAQTKLFQERVLPDLDSNIKSGNSLIGSDFYDSAQINLFDEEERYRINVFDWEDELAQVFADGGFDTVIGNPPWGALFNEDEKKHLVGVYPSISTKTKDSYLYFITKSIDLTKEDGFIGFIVPNTWLLINYAKNFRLKLLNYDIEEIRDYGDGVFSKATVESSTLLFRKSQNYKKSCRSVRLRRGNVIVDHFVDKSLWRSDDQTRIVIEMTKEKHDLLQKLKKDSDPFDEKCKIIWGIKPYQVGHGTPPQTKDILKARTYHSSYAENSEWKPLLVGSDVNRYSVSFDNNRYIKYGEWLMYPSNEKAILQDKILLRQTSDVLRAGLDTEKYYPQNSVFIIYSDEVNLHYLLGLLNSRLFNFVYQLSNPQTKKTFAEIKPSVIKELPLKRIDTLEANTKALYDRLIDSVVSIMTLQKQAKATKTVQDKKVLERQIKAIDRQIDQSVYKLYDLTPEEIALVEEN